MDPDPDPDRPPTRHLERLEVDRFRLSRTTIREVGEGFVVLDASGTSDTSATRLPRGVALAGEPIAAGSLTVRVEAVGLRTFRYRFALGTDVPAGDTPMLATDVRVTEAARCDRTDAGVSITTGEASVEVEVPAVGGPTLRVRRADGLLVGTVGGSESNLLSAWDAFPTGICRTPVPRHRLATEVFSIRDDECVYGFGERFGRLDKVGQTIDVDMQEAMGTVTPRAYKNVPFWVTTAGWGVFANHDARLTAWIGSRCAPQLQVAVDDDWFDAFVFVGDVRQVLQAYTDLTGRPNVPPDWSFGFWQSKISYSSAAETLEVADADAGRGPAVRRAAPRHPLVPPRLVLRPRVRPRPVPRPRRLPRRHGGDGREGVVVAAALHPRGLGAVRRAGGGRRVRAPRGRQPLRRGALLHAGLGGWTGRVHRLHQPRRGRGVPAVARRAVRPRCAGDQGRLR